MSQSTTENANLVTVQDIRARFSARGQLAEWARQHDFPQSTAYRILHGIEEPCTRQLASIARALGFTVVDGQIANPDLATSRRTKGTILVPRVFVPTPEQSTPPQHFRVNFEVPGDIDPAQIAIALSRKLRVKPALIESVLRGEPLEFDVIGLRLYSRMLQEDWNWDLYRLIGTLRQWPRHGVIRAVSVIQRFSEKHGFEFDHVEAILQGYFLSNELQTRAIVSALKAEDWLTYIGIRQDGLSEYLDPTHEKFAPDSNVFRNWVNEQGLRYVFARDILTGKRPVKSAMGERLQTALLTIGVVLPEFDEKKDPSHDGEQVGGVTR